LGRKRQTLAALPGVDSNGASGRMGSEGDEDRSGEDARGTEDTAAVDIGVEDDTHLMVSTDMDDGSSESEPGWESGEGAFDRPSPRCNSGNVISAVYLTAPPSGKSSSF
jgi:hypothetical protein